MWNSLVIQPLQKLIDYLLLQEADDQFRKALTNILADLGLAKDWTGIKLALQGRRVGMANVMQIEVALADCHRRFWRGQ